MNCSESQNLLQRRLDGEPMGDGAELARHLAACAECRSLHAAADRLEAGLRLGRAPVVPAYFSEAVVGHILADQRGRRRLRWYASAALAACLLLALGLGFYWQGIGFTNKTVPIASSTAPTDQKIAKNDKVTPPAAKPPSFRENMAQAGSAVASLTRRATDETWNESLMLIPETLSAPSLGGSAPIKGALDTSAQPLREAREGVTAGLEPVTTSAKRAMNMFMRDIPLSSEN